MCMSNASCVIRVIVSLKGVEWSGYRLTITNRRLLIDRRQNLFIEIPRRLSYPPLHYICRALPAWWQTLMTEPSWTIRAEQCSLADCADQQLWCGGEAHCRGGPPLELVLHHCWLLLSHDYTSFRLTILINPRRSLIYYSWVHCNALQGYRWWLWCIIPSIERCDCRRRLYCSFRVSLF